MTKHLTCQTCGDDFPAADMHLRTITFELVGWCADCWAVRVPEQQGVPLERVSR